MTASEPAPLPPSSQGGPRPRSFSVRLKILAVTLLSALSIIGVNTWFNLNHSIQVEQQWEADSLRSDYTNYTIQVDRMSQTSASLATSIAADSKVATLLAERDRQGLMTLLEPLYKELSTRFSVTHLYIHEPTGFVFLRVHKPLEFGDAFVTYRQTLLDVMATSQPVAGVELDPDRMGVRGVAPIVQNGQVIGYVEVGLDYDQAFMEMLKQLTGADYRIWITRSAAAPTGLWPSDPNGISPSPRLFYYAGTVEPALLAPLDAATHEAVLDTGEPQIRFITNRGQELAVLVGPLYAYPKRIVGTIGIWRNRTKPLAQLRDSQIRTLLVAGGVALLGLALMWVLTSAVVLRPLAHLTAVAGRRLKGDLSAQVEILPRDEFGQLGETFNTLATRLSATLQMQQSTIAELTRVQLSLRQSEENLAITLQSIGDAVLATDDKGILTQINNAAQVLTGWSQDESIGRPFAEVVNLIDATTHQKTTNPVQRVLETRHGAGLPPNSLLICKDGRRRMVDDSAAPIRDASGKVIGVVVVLRDISEELRLQEQLRQSQKMEAIGRLAGGVAHDFNNLLTAILGNAELLRMKVSDDPESDGMLSQIVRASDRAAQLVRQLLTFSRKGPMQSIRVDLHEVVGEVVALLAHSIDRRIEIHQNLRADRPFVRGDATYLQNALLNLAVNARDAMPEGGMLTFSSRNVLVEPADADKTSDPLPSGRYVELSVTDTGVGMSREVQEKIFEPFFTTKEIGAGTGLGLASVYGCVKSHQGAIRVYSEVGKGSTFKILLPELTDEAMATTRSEPARQSRPVGAGAILLVDDEPAVRELASRALGSLGYTVTLAADGVEAIRYFTEHHSQIDLVILDLVMPRMGGEEAFRHMHKIGPGVPVLVSSGFSQNQAVDKLLAEGCAGFLSKPYRLDELAQEVATHIRKRG